LQIEIGVQRLSYVKIHKRSFSQQLAKALAGTEGHGYGDQRLTVFDSILKYGKL